MLPAFITPVDLRLRRITFICCACMMLLYTACKEDKVHEGCIEIDAAKNDEKIFTVDTTRAYDTIASTLECILRHKDGTVAGNYPVAFFIDSAETKKYTDSTGRTEPVWVKEGIYSLGIGNPSAYPCIIIYNLSVPGGKGCEINITLPANE